MLMPLSRLRPPLPRVLAGLPKLLGGTARVLPFRVQRRGILMVLQPILRERILAGELDFLRGRRLQVWIRDTGIRWTFGLQQRRLTLTRDTTADTVIRGSLADFLLLASRKVDPDTLFFQRRLVIEGDTDLGLTLKNLLDTLETEDLPPRLNSLLEWLATQYLHTSDPTRHA